MILFRALWFLARLLLYYFQGVFRFISKPGSRLLVPLALIACALLLRPLWHEEITAQLRLADPGYEPESQVLDVVLFVSIVTLIAAYYVVSRITAYTLSAVPLTMRPLWPQRKLEAKKQEITPAVVRVVVPPLPRRRT